MLRSTNDLQGYAVRAVDDEVGHIRSFLFDDRNFKLRYLVVDTGNWLPGRKVLVYPTAVGTPEWENRVVPMELTKDQIEKSPGIETDKPVSRQYQTDLHAYYGWPLYWTQGIYPAVAVPYLGSEESDETLEVDLVEDDGDPHLRSTAEVTGYHIAASDGDIGHVEDFILDTENHVLRYLVVDTRNWLPGGKKVLISPQWIDDVRWADAKVSVDLTQESIENSPAFDPSQPVNRELEENLYDYYGRPKYWHGVPDGVIG